MRHDDHTRKRHASENVSRLSLVRIGPRLHACFPHHRANQARLEQYPKVSDLFSLSKSRVATDWKSSFFSVLHTSTTEQLHGPPRGLLRQVSSSPGIATDAIDAIVRGDMDGILTRNADHNVGHFV